MIYSFTDLLFLESSEVIFRVALALLEDHEEQLLCCDSFEEIMEYLKVRVVRINWAFFFFTDLKRGACEWYI